VNATPSSAESTRGQIGQGIYSLADLGVYVAYAADSEWDPRAVLEWLQQALNPVGHRRHQPDYSFSDLVSLFVVRELRRHGVPLRRIREAEARLRARSGIDRPFVREDIATDGEEVFFATEADQVESANLSRKRRTGQQTSAVVLADYLHRIRYEDGAALSWSPTDHVVLDPVIQFGEPVIEGSRVPTATAAAMARESSPELAAHWLAVDRTGVDAAVRFEHELDAIRN
jgi:uncharacterized protein (DUF433 family)